MQKFSIIVPIYNEEASVRQSVESLTAFLKSRYRSGDYEIILVNDGSTDGTPNIIKNLADENLKVVTHSSNHGYGASLKTGARNSQCDVIMFFDGDGQHKSEYIPDLLKHIDEFDMVVGMRQGYRGPSWRQPGKILMGLLANYLVGKKIPDLNSGLRAVKKDLFMRFIHLFPDGFSLSTTSTLAFLSEGLTIKYIPININKREGKSTVRVKDGINALLLICRMIMLFNPMKIFGLASAILLLFGVVFSFYGILVYGRFPISGALTILFGLMLFFNGLLADQLAAIRKNLKD